VKTLALNDVYKSMKKYVSNRFASKIPPLTDVKPTPDFGGARTSIPKPLQFGSAGTALPKRVMRELSLDERRFSNMTVSDMIDILIDAHPDVSYAVWNFLRIGNTPYSVEVYKIGSGKRWAQAEKDLLEVFDRLELPNVFNFEKARGMGRIVNQLLLSAITRGSVACELVLTPKRDDVAFIAPIDPATIDYKIENDRYVPYQKMQTISLDLPTVFIEGLDEKIDDPYGRSPLMSALNIIVFQLQVLNDLKAVVHNHGYPRIDIKIVEEVLLKRMPVAIRNNEEKKQLWLSDRLKEIISMYTDLEPDDAFVHFDSVEIGTAGGGQGGGAMLDPEKLMNCIDNLIMTGLKTLSTVLGRRSSGNTESFAKLEIKIYMQGVRAMQELVETVLSRALTMALNIRGKQGNVKFKFQPIEIRTELEQEQFRLIKYQNIAYMRDQGWIDQETASQMVTGKSAVAEPNYEVLGQSAAATNKDGGTPKPSTDTNPSAGGNTDNSTSN
jgi:hypothetical protein